MKKLNSLSPELIDYLKNNKIRQRRQSMLLGGVISLKSYWTITNPELLNSIEGEMAEIKAEELSNDSYRLYIDLPLRNGK